VNFLENSVYAKFAEIVISELLRKPFLDVG